MNELALFAGAGGGILGGILCGWRTVCAVEIDTYCRERLMQRQDEGHLPAFPIWDDVRTFDGKPWAGCVDIVTGGFPCQDISAAGKGAGITGERSGLWKEMARIIGEVRPRFAFVENSPMLTSRGLGTVLGDLAEMGYDARWGVLGAVHAGAPHKRERIWILANSKSVRSFQATQRRQPRQSVPVMGCAESSAIPNADSSGRAWSGSAQPEERRDASEPIGSLPAVPNPNRPGFPKSRRPSEARGANGGTESTAVRGDWWSTEPALGRVAHGVANRVDRLRAIGNGQVPAVVRLAWEILKP